jgi:para-nitrobenzyl esterase
MTEVRTSLGRVRGSEARITGVCAFKGIPYAQAPVGPSQFKPPRPSVRWDGARDGSRFGPVPHQPATPGALGLIFTPPNPQGDDCLNLNVWTPDPGTAGLPVLVWIHGGGWTVGSGSDPLYDGSAYARDGVVTVTINYRLGVDGFLHVGEDAPGSGNFGTLDQIAALEWVQANIAAFGGDPARVTIAGESAGAMSVCMLLAAPAARGLFRGAIAQSGGAHNGLVANQAERVGGAIFDTLGLRRGDTDALANVPRDRLLDAQQSVSMELNASQDVEKWGDLLEKVPTLAYQPVIGLDVLPTHPIDAVRNGAAGGTPLLVGSNRDEYKLFTGAMPEFFPIDDAMLSFMVARVFGAEAPAALDRYRAQRSGATPVDLFAALQTDRQYRIPAIRLAEARTDKPARTWMYRLSWNSPAFEGRVGAGHATDLPFAFDNLDNSMAAGLVGENAPVDLAAEMHDAWVRFVKCGDPSGPDARTWPPYDIARRATKDFDAGHSRVIDDPASAERRLWDGLPDRLLGV